MKAIYAFGLLILIAFIGSRFIFKRSRNFSSIYFFFFSGMIYILLGLVFGESGLDILSREVLSGLLPLVAFGLGWVGFLFGFQLEFRYLKRFERSFQMLSLFQTFFVLVLSVGLLNWFLKRFFPEQSGYFLYGMAVAFGLLLTLNSPSLVNAISGSLPSRGGHYFLVRFLVSVSGFWGIFGLALLSSFWHSPFFKGLLFLKGSLLFAAATLLSVGMGSLFHLLSRKRIREPDLLVIMLGLVFFVSGAAFSFNFAPLYTGMVMGITFSNLTRRHERIYPLLLSTEKPLYIIFLVLIGALWQFRINIEIILLVLILVVLRLAAYTLPLPVFQRLLRFPLRLPEVFGLCFLSTGGIGIAFAVSIKLGFLLPLTDEFLSIALLSILINEFLSPWAMRLALRRVGIKK
jgi:hypothetical protein